MIGFKNADKVNDNGESVVRGFSSDTEVKTNHGWKLISEVDPKADLVLAAKPVTLEMVYAKPLDVAVEPYEGTLLHFKTRQVDLMLTDNTPLNLIRKRCIKSDEYVYSALQAPTAEAVKKTDMLPLSGFCYNDGEELEFVLPAITVTRRKKEILIPEKRLPAKAWLEFFGFWLADGCWRGPRSNGKVTYSVYIKQSETNEDYVLSLIKNIGFVPHIEHYRAKGYNNYCIQDRQLWEYLRQFGRSKDKYIPEEFLSLAPEYLEVLFRGYKNGDSTISHGCTILSSASKRLLDNVQELVLKLEGSVTQIRKEYYTLKDETRCWVWVLGYRPNRASKNRTCYGAAKQVKYQGDVCSLCLEGEQKMALLRRNGTIMWAAC